MSTQPSSKERLAAALVRVRSEQLARSRMAAAAVKGSAWVITKEQDGERHTHGELGLTIDVMRDELGVVVLVHTRIEQLTGVLELERAIRATGELNKRLRSLKGQANRRAA